MNQAKSHQLQSLQEALSKKDVLHRLHGATQRLDRSRRIKGMPTYMQTIRYLGECGFELSGLYRWPATARSACSSSTA
jgi:hypothetical protein